jgi:CelD/BcsL family acetyltransferase involved in cellulose biosynthesis
VRWYVVEDETSLDREIDALYTLMSHDPEKESFLTHAMSSQMRAMIHAAFRANWLELAFMEVGDKKAAAHLNFDFANRIWAYNSGIDFQFRELSPGWVLLSHLIQRAIEAKREVFDFMRGDEMYKYRFGGVNRYVMRVQVRR